MKLTLALALALLLPAAAVARAEEPAAYEVEGEADAGASDARVAALDEAFARATERALGELVTPDVRAAHKADLDREIVARARLWVAKFTVARDATEDGRRQLSVSVRIDRDKLRARLGELGISLGPSGAADPPDATPPPDHASAPHGRSAAILLRITRSAGVSADYGPSGNADLSGVAALTTALRSAGLAIRRAPTTGAPPRATGDLPLDDDEADALAAGAHADLALVAGVTVGSATAVRGLAGPATLVTAHVRLIQRGDHKVLGEGTAAVASLVEDDAAAIESALAGAAADVVPPPPQAMQAAAAFHGDDTPIAEPGVVLVRMSSRTPYALVVAEQKYLLGAKGVRGATVRRLSPGGWVIGVATSEPVERVAQIAKKAPTPDAEPAVKIRGDIVELELTGANR